MNLPIELLVLSTVVAFLAMTFCVLLFRERTIRAAQKAHNAEQLIENLAVGVYRSSIDGKQLSANAALVALNGYTSEAELLAGVGDIAREWYVDPSRRRDFKCLLERDGMVSDFVSEIYRHKTRERIWISETARLVKHHRTGKPLYYEGTVREVTSEVIQQRSDVLLKNLTEKLPHALFRIIRHSDGTHSCPFASARFLEMLGLPEGSELDPAVFVRRIHKSDIGDYIRAYERARTDMAQWKAEFRLYRTDGTFEWCKISANPEHAPDGELLWHGYLSIITDRKQTEDKIYKLAYFDPLTGLSNRSCFMQDAAKVLERADRNKSIAALGFIDLDNFKHLNDTHGHGFGDALLIAAAERLKEALPKKHLLSRFGGDEFVILLPSLGKDQRSAQQKVERISEKLLKEIQHGFIINGIDCPMTMSLGISMYDPEKGMPISDLLKSADVAMYEAKKSGRNNVVIHDIGMLKEVAERYKLQRDIQIAIRDGQMEIELQPQVSANGQVRYAETLVRWNHPVHGRIMPQDFIGLAEQTGQIGRLNDWVLKRSIEMLADWKKSPALKPISLSVNISPRQMIDPAFADSVLRLLEELDVPGEQLVLELTEHAMARNPDAVERHMRILQTKGIRFSLDDFGTGYSSISQLRQFPFDELKVDGSFVADVANDKDALNIVTAIINMARALGLQTVAEHVSTYEQFETLSGLGCDIFQGYLFSRPLKVADFETLISARAPEKVKRTAVAALR
ncbi:MAG: EAL domain-containing protein [Pseudomonadota bacterium]